MKAGFVKISFKLYRFSNDIYPIVKYFLKTKHLIQYYVDSLIFLTDTISLLRH